jgi:hypothetical protein
MDVFDGCFFVLLEHSFYFLLTLFFFFSFRQNDQNDHTTVFGGQGGTWTVGTRTIWT